MALVVGHTVPSCRVPFYPIHSLSKKCVSVSEVKATFLNLIWPHPQLRPLTIVRNAQSVTASA